MKKFLRKGGIWVLLIALLLTAAVGLGHFFTPGLTDPILRGMGTLAAPFRSAATFVTDRVDAVYDYTFRYEELREQLTQLEGEVARLREENRAAQVALEENRRLRTLLGLRQAHDDFVYEAAAVTGRAPSNWNYALTISKGSEAGVERDMCVVTEQGYLVGIVTEVGSNWAEITALISPDISIGVRAEPTGDAAVLTCDLDHMSAGTCALSYLSGDAALTAGDAVVTSGLGGHYPAGLMVGTVQETGIIPSGMERYAVVKPSVNWDDLKQVFVIKAFDVVE